MGKLDLGKKGKHNTNTGKRKIHRNLQDTKMCRTSDFKLCKFEGVYKIKIAQKMLLI